MNGHWFSSVRDRHKSHSNIAEHVVVIDIYTAAVEHSHTPLKDDREPDRTRGSRAHSGAWSRLINTDVGHNREVWVDNGCCCECSNISNLYRLRSSVEGFWVLTPNHELVYVLCRSSELTDIIALKHIINRL